MFYFLYDFDGKGVGVGREVLDELLNPNHIKKSVVYSSYSGIESCHFSKWDNECIESGVKIGVGEGGLHITAWARLDNQQELVSKLNVESDNIIDDEMLLCLAWRKWREDCVHYLSGEFTFVIFDRDENTVFGARDHFGTRPFYYSVNMGRFACASTIPPIRKVLNGRGGIKQQWLVDYLSDLSMSFEDTVFDGIKKLPPGCCLTVKNREVEVRQYYALSVPEPLHLEDTSTYIASFREQLIEAVGKKIEAEQKVGCELSGGLDSAGIAGMASSMMGDKKLLQCFSFLVFEKEPEVIREVLEKIGSPPIHSVGWDELTRNHVQRMDEAARFVGQPVEHESATFHLPFYQVADQLGVKVLLSGFGGDEFVSNVHKKLVFSSLVRKGEYDHLLDCFQGNWFARLARMIKMIAKERVKGIFADNTSSLSKVSEQYWMHSCIKKEVAQRYRLRERFFEKAVFDAGYDDLHEFLVERRWQPFIPTRMELCSVLAASHGVEYRWPLLDRKLIETYLSMPAHLNIADGLGRNLYRQAVKPFIPETVFKNRGKNMGRTTVSLEDEFLLKNHILADQLHPMLKEIIDQNKYSKLLQRYMSGDQDDTLKLYYERLVRKVYHLNEWLSGTGAAVRC